MDILDEIDAQLLEKKSKWKYTPMREKSETDALIDDLLDEFSPVEKKSYSSPVREKKPVPVINEERRERIEYEKATEAQPHFDIPPAEDEVVIPQDLGEPEEESYDYSEEYAEEYAEEYSDEYGEEYYDSEEYDEYDEEYDEDYDYDEEYDYDDEYDDSYNDGGDFDSFMDSENESQKGDMPKYWFSGLIKTVLKIVVLAAFGALAVFGAINAIDVLRDKFGDKEVVSETDKLKSEFRDVIMPLVVMDLEDFDDVSTLKSEDYINIAVWELVINGEKTAFIDEESGECRLPQEQMSYIVEKLFGDVKLEHCSAGVGEVEIKYDKKNKWYVIPENTDVFTFTPKVTDIADTAPIYTVYADCYTSSPSWKDGKAEASKRVMITLTKTDDYYNIVSQKTIPVE